MVRILDNTLIFSFAKLFSNYLSKEMSSDTQITGIFLAIKALTANFDDLTVEGIIKMPAKEVPCLSTNRPEALLNVFSD
ncbi:hypothetical protein AYI68_g8214 [Smittium mucronatum]|uniref:Uncharacterized protein n=1 Tax=Smittium mucronatum TaxID=133383 RepID=A0A1R0GLI6_9FUNG|nr:hypothetical protein AYI68_g8214 [Smittium mucronatum]